MRKRPIMKVRPGLKPLEAKRLLSVNASTAPFVNLKAGSRALASHPADRPGALGAVVAAMATKPDHGYLVYRITNPNRFNNKLILPFSQVLVQSRQPVPGQVYNVLYVVVRNGTAQHLRREQRVQGQVPRAT